MCNVMIIHIQSCVLTSSVNCWAIAFLIRPITVAFSSPIYTLIRKCTEQANVISKVITVKPPLTAASPQWPLYFVPEDNPYIYSC